MQGSIGVRRNPVCGFMSGFPTAGWEDGRDASENCTSSVAVPERPWSHNVPENGGLVGAATGKCGGAVRKIV